MGDTDHTWSTWNGALEYWNETVSVRDQKKNWDNPEHKTAKINEKPLVIKLIT